MVTATQGFLITGDVALIEYIRALNDQQPPADRFVIESLDDTHLFIKDKWAQWVADKVLAWQQGLRFEPKQRDHQ